MIRKYRVSERFCSGKDTPPQITFWSHEENHNFTMEGPDGHSSDPGVNLHITNVRKPALPGLQMWRNIKSNIIYYIFLLTLFNFNLITLLDLTSSKRKQRKLRDVYRTWEIVEHRWLGLSDTLALGEKKDCSRLKEPHHHYSPGWNPSLDKVVVKNIFAKCRKFQISRY